MSWMLTYRRGVNAISSARAGIAIIYHLLLIYSVRRGNYQAGRSMGQSG